jgi:hypothetical protein
VQCPAVQVPPVPHCPLFAQVPAVQTPFSDPPAPDPHVPLSQSAAL